MLGAFGTPGNVNDTVVLRTVLAGIRRRGFSGGRFNADRGYDSDANWEAVFLRGMIPDIKGCHRPGQARQGEGGRTVQPRRVRAGGPMGDLWSRGEQGAPAALQARPGRQPGTVSQGRTIARNIRALHRFEHANRLRIPIPSYGAQARSAPEPGAD